MTDFTPKQVRLFGDRQKSGEFVGIGYKLLWKLKEFMQYNKLKVAGPWSWDGPGWRVVVKSMDGVRDFVDVYTVVGGGVARKFLKATTDKMLLFWGKNYERIDFRYVKESGLFIPGNVSCSDSGSGEVEFVFADRLVGMFTRCWSVGGSVNQAPLASGIITNCRREWFADTYDTRELIAGFDYSMKTENVLSPSDELQISCGMNAGNKAFSKTVGKLTAEAFEYGDMTYSLNWVLCAKYKGKQVIFPDGSPSFTASDFRRTGLYFQGIYLRLHTYEVLFDCWEEGGVLYLGACGQNVMRVWRITEEAEAVSVLTHTIKGKGYEPAGSTPANYRPYVCGYAKWTAFIDRGGYGIVLETSYGIQGSNGTKKAVISTLWNHLNDKLYCWVDGRETIVQPDYVYGTVVDSCWSSFYIGGAFCGCGTCGDGVNSCLQYEDPPKCPTVEPETYTVCHDYTVAGQTITVCATVNYGMQAGESVDRFYTTHYTIHVYKAVTTTYGEMRIEEIGLDGKGKDYAVYDCGRYTLTTGSYYMYAGLDSSADFWGSLLCDCYTSRTAYTLEDWNVMPDGIAYEISSKKIDTCAGFGGGCSATDVTKRGATIGRLFLAYDEWEAFLKYGVDRNGKSLSAPAYVFRHALTSGIVLYFGEELTMNVLGDGDRAFFQYVANLGEED